MGIQRGLQGMKFLICEQLIVVGTSWYSHPLSHQFEPVYLLLCYFKVKILFALSTQLLPLAPRGYLQQQTYITSNDRQKKYHHQTVDSKPMHFQDTRAKNAPSNHGPPRPLHPLTTKSSSGENYSPILSVTGRK